MEIVSRSDLRRASLALSRVVRKLPAPMVASIPIMTITTISSMRVNPREEDRFLSKFILLQYRFFSRVMSSCWIDYQCYFWLHEVRMNMRESGQIGLLMLVVMGVLVTLSLSVATRSLSDVVTSRQDREDSAVFNVAEQGIERGLYDVYTGTPPSGPQSISDSQGFAQGSYEVLQSNSYVITVGEGEVAEVDLLGWNGGDFDIRWVKRGTGEEVACGNASSGNAPAAIEVIILRTSNNLQHLYYNSYGCNLTSSNSFQVASNTDPNYLSRQTLNGLGDNIVSIRIRPIYNAATISVTGGTFAIPAQQYIVQSKATGGDAQTNIEAKRSNSYAPSIFDFAVFSYGGSLLK